MIQQFRIKKAGKYVQNIAFDSASKKNTIITYTEYCNNSLVISELEILKYQKILDNIIGYGSYSIEPANDLD